MTDAVSRTFHDHVRPEEGHGPEDTPGHKHGHVHSDHSSHDNGGHHGERIDDPSGILVLHTVAHIGGLSIHTLESAFKETEVFEDVIAKKAFSTMRNEVSDRPGQGETEFQFVIGSGRRK
jgi:hypothetical protein